MIHVVGAEKVSALPGDDVQGRLIQVCQVCGEALGRAVMLASVNTLLARSRFASPRHPDADRLRAERLLAPDDRERERRPLQRVVVDTDEEGGGAVRRADGEPDADAE